MYEDSVLVSGSLAALIQHATPTPSYYPDTAYLFAFLLSSRLFIRPHELLGRVCRLGFHQQGIDLEGGTATGYSVSENEVVTSTIVVTEILSIEWV